MEKGYSEGMQKGMQEGKAKGRAEGRAEGIEQARRDVAEKMKAAGIDPSVIKSCTGI